MTTTGGDDLARVSRSQLRRPDDDAEFRAQLGGALGADYRVEQLIGEGGFGRVYSATDVRLGRPVAVKAIRPDLAGARAFTDRFRKEATALAKFRHPGIVPIYDINEKDGLIFFVMPLIGGDTLRARLDKHRRIAPQETRKILVELCDCLAATHRAGIVHRDIKPENVMLEGAVGKALLMDFGIAKSMADSDTASGFLVGTPTYMSPEQANGDPVIDHRSDIYSIGVLGYHMLTGRPPFVGESSREVITAHLIHEPTPIRKLNPSVSKAFADAIMRCLEKKPEDRFQETVELSADLQRIVFGTETDPVDAHPVSLAMPFFFGISLTWALLAVVRVNYVPIRNAHLWLAAVAFAALGVFCSPVVRTVMEPFATAMREKLRRR